MKILTRLRAWWRWQRTDCPAGNRHDMHYKWLGGTVFIEVCSRCGGWCPDRRPEG